jgi:type 1 fimbriae regulatory protein FimB
LVGDLNLRPPRPERGALDGHWLRGAVHRGPTIPGFAKLLRAAAKRAGIGNAHPHALRHACGHAPAIKGRETRLIQDYLGHRNITHTSLYTDGVSRRFKGIGGTERRSSP